MTIFRLLRPHCIGAAYYQAGEIVSDKHGDIPTDWRPPNPEEVEAIDSDAMFRVIEVERELRKRRGE